MFSVNNIFCHKNHIFSSYSIDPYFFYLFCMRNITFFVLFFTFLSYSALVPVSAADIMCAQVIQYAENPTTSECQAFPTPCDVPSGWTAVDMCKLPIKTSLVPKFEVQKFASCEAMEDKIVRILERYQSRYWYPYPSLYSR